MSFLLKGNCKSHILIAVNSCCWHQKITSIHTRHLFSFQYYSNVNIHIYILYVYINVVCRFCRLSIYCLFLIERAQKLLSSVFFCLFARQFCNTHTQSLKITHNINDQGAQIERCYQPKNRVNRRQLGRLKLLSPLLFCGASTSLPSIVPQLSTGSWTARASWKEPEGNCSEDGSVEA